MGKLGLLLLLVLGLLIWFRYKSGRSVKERSEEPSTREVESMLACAHCGVFLPAGEVVAGGNGRPYCSEAHRLADERR
jgi:uncharacterized protein